MLRQLQKVGNSKGIVLTRTMLDHLGIVGNDGSPRQVDLTMEKDAIVIRPAPSPRPQTFEDALEETFEQYDNTMKRLAE